MRVLMDGRTMGDKPSGVGMYGYNFARGLLECADDIELYIVTDIAKSLQIAELQQSRAIVIEYGVKVAKSFALQKYFRFVQKEIHEIKPDIFWEINNLFPIKLVNPYGKIITTVHDVFPYTMPECFGKIYPYYFKHGIRNMLRYTDAIVYDSEESKKQLEYYEPCASEKESTILYVMMYEKSQKKLQKQREEDAFYFYIGNLEKRKGSDILLRGYEKYHTLGGEKKLYFGGQIREDEIKQLIEQIETKKIGAHYVGYVSAEEKELYLTSAAGFIFPSRAEGFGMPALEALECDCPVLVSDLSIFKEILGDSVERFNLFDETEVAAEELAKKMLAMDMIGKEKLHEKHSSAVKAILPRYHKEKLIPQLTGFMRELGE